METNLLIGGVDFNTIRHAQFRKRNGDLFTLAKIIYNGFKNNLGTHDGAVVINNNYLLWKFIAPADRYDMEHFAPLTLRQALEEIREDTENAPVPAWDNFFEFLGEPENEAAFNAILHGKTSSIHIAYRNTDLPLLRGTKDFPGFVTWLARNCGEAGAIPASTFINGQDMIIPLDLYTATPLRGRLKTPTIEPTWIGDEMPVFTISGENAVVYGTKNGLYHYPVLYIGMDDGTLLYSFHMMADINGLAVPAGWSKFDGATYAPYDIEANPIALEYGEGMEMTYLAKAFFDIEYESAYSDVFRLRETIDLDSLPEGLCIETYSHTIMLSEDGYLLVVTGETEDQMRMFAYFAQDTEVDGRVMKAGWNTIDPTDGEPAPHDMANRPVYVDIFDGAAEDLSAMGAVAHFVERKLKAKEKHIGTIHFMLRA